MDIDELRLKQAEYEGERQEKKKKIDILEKERLRFLNIFSEKKLKTLEIDEYVSGKKNKRSFCNYLETGLRELGEIHGYTSFKFGIYYGIENSDRTPKYRFSRYFGSNKLEAYENVMKEIMSLLAAAKTENIQAIKDNNLTNMFKGKILSIYYPDKYLNIFSKEHLDYFLNKLEISVPDLFDEVDKRQLLMEFKNEDILMREWKTIEFTNFLYAKF